MCRGTILAEDTTPVEGKDTNPALASAAPQFDTNPEEGVDTGTLPPFQDVKHLLPAERFSLQAGLAKIGAALPDRLKKQDGDIDFSDLQPEDMDAMMDLFKSIQTLVLRNAESRRAMEEWLKAQEQPMNALMFAFSRFQDVLGN